MNEKLLDCKVEYSNIIDNERIEVSDIRKVDVNSIKNEDSRSFGCEWLSKQVIDAGIATEENLKHLREKSLESICVRRSNRSEYSIVGSEPVTVLDNRNNPIEIQIVKSDKKGDNDLYLYVKSEMKYTRPNQEQARLYSALNFKQSNPQMRKKAVVPHS